MTRHELYAKYADNRFTLQHVTSASIEGYHEVGPIHCGGIKWKVFADADGEFVGASPTAMSRESGRIGIHRVGPDQWENAYYCGVQRHRDAGQVLGAALSATHGDYGALCAMLGRSTGRCAICGCELTVQDSIDQGIGPECIKKFMKRPALRYVMESRYKQLSAT